MTSEGVGEFRSAYVRTVASYLPDRRVSNDAIVRSLVEASSAVPEHERREYERRGVRIEEKTGIKSRRFFSDADDLVDIAASVAEQLVAQNEWSELDAILVSSGSVQGFPGLAQTLLAALRARHGEIGDPFTLDVSSNACTGFVSALALAASLIETQGYRDVLCLAVEAVSRCISLNVRSFNSSVLFGDGVGGVLVSGRGGVARLAACRLASRVSGETLGLVRGGGRMLGDVERLPEHQCWHVAGPKVADLAVQVLADEIEHYRRRGWNPDWIIPHQANREMILHRAAGVAGVAPERMLCTLDFAGNTASASVPLTLHHFACEGRFKAGDQLLLVGFGGSFTVASAYLELGGAPGAPVWADAARSAEQIVDGGRSLAAPAEADFVPDQGVVAFEAGGWQSDVALRGMAGQFSISEAKGQAEGERVAALMEFVSGMPSGVAREVLRGRPASARRVVFMFPGQGSLRGGAAAELYRCNEVFRSSFDECGAILGPHLPLPLRQALLSRAQETLNRPAIAQPLTVSVGYSLARMWQAWGVRPWAVIGHSLGEYVAACISGVMTLPDMLWLVAQRARLTAAVPGDGAMMGVVGPRPAVQALLEREIELEPAAFNSSSNMTWAGPASVVERALAQLRGTGPRGTPHGTALRAVRVDTSHAFHSRQMDAMLPAYEALLRSIDLRPPSITFVSNLSGAEARHEVADANYWVDQIRHPVRFEQGLTWLLEQGANVFLELGANRVLGAFVGEVSAALGAHDVDVAGLVNVPSLAPDVRDHRAVLRAAAELWVHGIPARPELSVLKMGCPSGVGTSLAAPLDQLRLGAISCSAALDAILHSHPDTANLVS